MNTNKLKKFAQETRRKLIALVSARLDYVLKADTAELRGLERQVEEVKKQIKASSREELIEKVAYTWFNRFMALRFMDANDYHGFKVRVLSPAEGHSQPEILEKAKAGDVDVELKLDRVKLEENISTGADNAAMRRLVVAVCNHYFEVMPFMFEKVSDYTELLMPEDLLSESSVVAEVVAAMGPEECENVEVIGWLYQFYISVKHDEVMAGMKTKKKITEANIPAATQLFTPHWIVQYMVDNTLGKLWMKNRPNSRLRQQMEFYIHSEQEEDFIKLNSPEDIKMSDPACGSGHILVYAFDLLVKIYEEEGYDSNEIPSLILKKNLYGVDVDDRATALANFALMMKGRGVYKRFLRKGGILPNVIAMQNVAFEKGEIDNYVKEIGENLFTMGLRETLELFEHAKNFGSLIKPQVWDVDSVRKVLLEQNMENKMFSNTYPTHLKVLTVMDQLPYLGKQFNVLVANPPYMNSSGMNPDLANYVKENYADYKSDMFSACMVRFLDMTVDKAELGFMSPFVWMFISSYEKLRMRFIEKETITSLIQLEYSGFEGATVPICTFTLKNQVCDDRFKGSYIKLSDFKGHQNQAPKALEAVRNMDCGWFYRVSQKDFLKVPRTPISYWIPKDVAVLFENEKLVNDIAKTRVGLQTGDNNRFLRLWHEVSLKKLCLSQKHGIDMSGVKEKWFPYNKGGSHRRWYGNQEYVVNWENRGQEIYSLARDLYGSPTRTVKNAGFYFRPSVTWTTISSGKPSFRYQPEGAIFDVAGASVFFESQEICYSLLASLNSKVCEILLGVLAPTLNYQTSDIGSLPFKILSNNVIDLTKELVNLSRNEWDSNECSWNFICPNLMKGEKLSTWMEKLITQCTNINNQIHYKEVEVNSLVKNDYGLSHMDLGSTDIPKEKNINITTIANNLLSYATGCMFGRYSLDKPGLILANQGETLADYLKVIPTPTFLPDEDNIIPIVDGDYFSDDIVARFKTFLKVSFGEEHYQENLNFIEDALGKDIRKYFLKDFYPDHLKRYKKRPIYWLFSSPKGSFNCLIYMHRYRSDTVSRIVSNYLQEFIHKLGAQTEALKNLTVKADTTPAAKAKAEKEMDKIKKTIKELQDYERDTMLPLAQQKIEIDLDDGVKQNYPKFGPALYKIPGLDSKDD